ncbi:MAG: mce12E [Nocardia sp.]|uniref:MlaD family protein n=1 Tax=Nocardia sp. TaxID=1821 RepID=UPI0026187982|nr:MlaD family protein [Nocardia sp.]MCU1646250.1 mce12E [Nocardia sp.]
MRRARWCAIAPAAAVLALSGCGVDPSSIVLPGTTVSGSTYPVSIEFANALNLPTRAKVMANGTRVGDLHSVTVVDTTAAGGGHVVARVDVTDSVRLPVDTTAELRQDTVLGDIYIALITPPGGADGRIEPGGRIPLAHTVPAQQIEDVMAGLATFVSGGTVRQMQDIVNRMNAVLPQDPKETARVFGALGANLTDIAANLRSVDDFLAAMGSDSTVLLNNQRALSELLTAEGVDQVTGSMNSIVLTLGLLEPLGEVAQSLQFLGPTVDSLDSAAKAMMPLLFTGRPLDLSAPSNLNKLVALLRDKVIPFVEMGPKVNIAGVDTGAAPVSGADQTDQIVRVLRMIGAVR